MELLTAHGEDGTNVAELGIGTNEEATADRQHPRGREDPRHRPRRLRRLGGDRRHRPGPGPPRLRRARARRRDRRRGDRPRRRAAGLSVATAARRPQRLRGARRRRASPRSRRAFAARRRAARPPLRRRPQPHRLHPRRRARRALARRARSPAPRQAIETIDMAAYDGVHPAIGALDVCPLVWLDPADREPARAEARRASPSRSAGSACPVFLYGELATRARARRARLLPQRRPRRALAADGGRRAAPRLRPGPAAPHRRRDPGHRPPAARRLQRRARQRRRRARPRGRRRAARVGRRPAGRAGDRARRSSSGRAQVSTNVHDPLAVPLASVVERVRALAAPLGARPVEAELVGLVPEAALAGYPEDVPIRGFDPGRTDDRARGSRPSA